MLCFLQLLLYAVILVADPAVNAVCIQTELTRMPRQWSCIVFRAGVSLGLKDEGGIAPWVVVTSRSLSTNESMLGVGLIMLQQWTPTHTLKVIINNQCKQ